MSVLVALAALVLVTAIASIVQFMLNSSERGQKSAKIRFAISIIENRIRLKLSLPETYTCYPFNDPLLGAITRCDFDPLFWDEFKKAIPGAQCAAGATFCGVRVLGGPAFVQGSTLPLKISNIRVEYLGTDYRMNPIVLDAIEVPSEAISGTSAGACPNVGDIFKGIQKDGTIVCQPRPSCLALTGHYFVGLDSKGNAICKQLNGIDFDLSGNITRIPGLSCANASDGSQKYIDGIQFNCESSAKKCQIVIQCRERVDPCSIANSGSYCPQ